MVMDFIYNILPRLNSQVRNFNLSKKIDKVKLSAKSKKTQVNIDDPNKKSIYKDQKDTPIIDERV